MNHSSESRNHPTLFFFSISLAYNNFWFFLFRGSPIECNYYIFRLSDSGFAYICSSFHEIWKAGEKVEGEFEYVKNSDVFMKLIHSRKNYESGAQT